MPSGSERGVRVLSCVLKIGLAQVGLLQRTTSTSATQAQEIRERAAQSPDDAEAQMAVADLDISGGHVEDGLNRLVTFVATHRGPDSDVADTREKARLRLLELFDVVGGSDPRVAKARQELAKALF